MITVKAEPIDRDIKLMLDETVSKKAQSAAFAEFAHEQIEDAKATNRSVLGRVPRYTVAVDGLMGAPLQSVRPDGVIIAEFELVTDVLAWIGEQLVLHSPVKSGRYQKSHTLFADGVETQVGGAIPAASEYVFLSTVPYARKIEKGSSSQASSGVYQVVAVLAAKRFGNIARVSFSYRTPLSGSILGGHAGNKSRGRQPAILVKTEGR